MTLIEELEAELSSINNLIYNLQEAVLIFDYLTSEKEDAFEWDVIRNSIYFTKARDDNFDVIILHLSHLFLPTETFNLPTFINKFNQSGKYESLNIPLEVKSKWKGEIKKQKKVIESVRQVRINYVAHRDIVRLHNSGISKLDIKKLLAIAQTIMIDTYTLILHRDYQVKPFGGTLDDLKQIIAKLARLHKEHLAPLLAEAKKYDIKY